MFTPSEIAERIKLCAKQKGVTVKTALQNAGVGEKMVSNMSGKKGSYPQSDKLAKIADFFDCSVDYLLGRKETKKAAVLSVESSDTKKEQLIKNYELLNDEGQEDLLDYSEMLASNPRKIKESNNSVQINA